MSQRISVSMPECAWTVRTVTPPASCSNPVHSVSISIPTGIAAHRLSRLFLDRVLGNDVFQGVGRGLAGSGSGRVLRRSARGGRGPNGRSPRRATIPYRPVDTPHTKSPWCGRRRRAPWGDPSWCYSAPRPRREYRSGRAAVPSKALPDRRDNEHGTCMRHMLDSEES